jgi:hypothetical protein
MRLTEFIFKMVCLWLTPKHRFAQAFSLAGVRLKVSVRRGVSPHFFRGEGREVAEKGAGLTPAPHWH